MSAFPESFPALIAPVLLELEMELSTDQLHLLSRHFQLLMQWNARMNLTSVRDPRRIVSRHFGESLFLAKTLGLRSETVADLGSGAGFPGFPLAVCCPFARVTLVESVMKKAAFLKELSRLVTNVDVFHGRLLDLCRDFDWATVRGVSCGEILPDITTKARNVAVLTGKGAARRLETPNGTRWLGTHQGAQWSAFRRFTFGSAVLLVASRRECSTWNIPS